MAQHKRTSQEMFESIMDRFSAKYLESLEAIAPLRGLASLEPAVQDSEIIVCFADVRGFTQYCRKLQQDSHDRKIQNFLRRYFKIFAEGLLLWHADWRANARLDK